MSHYRVAVFANSPEEFEDLLAPYNEQDEMYFEFFPVSSEEVAERYDEYQQNSTIFDSFNDYLSDYGYTKDPDTGQFGYCYNPNAKWDWYTLDGGEWQFDLKPGEHYGHNGYAKKNQYNYWEKQYSKQRSIKHWNEQKDLAESNEDTQEAGFARWFMKDNPDLNTYLRQCKLNYPYAFITPDGEWHSPGTVGWFGCSDDTPDTMNAYLDEWETWINSDQNPYVTFVDCHI